MATTALNVSSAVDKIIRHRTSYPAAALNFSSSARRLCADFFQHMASGAEYWCFVFCSGQVGPCFCVSVFWPGRLGRVLCFRVLLRPLKTLTGDESRRPSGSATAHVGAQRGARAAAGAGRPEATLRLHAIGPWIGRLAVRPMDRASWGSET